MEIYLFEINTEQTNKLTLNVNVPPSQVERWEDNLDEFIQDNLQELGVYELDRWDDDKCIIQISDDPDDYSAQEIKDNFEQVVTEVKTFLKV